MNYIGLYGLSEPEFYGYFGISLENIIGITEFSDHFSKLVICYKRKEYNIDAIKQSACLAVNPVTVDHLDYLFNCTPLSMGSDDSMMVPT